MEKMEAHEWLKHVKDERVSPGDIVERYGRTSDQYEQSMATLNYNGAVETARMLAQLIPEGRDEATLLDIAAGTGLCAVELHRYGFRNMVAMDPSEVMLRKAKRKNLYNEYINEALGDQPLPIADNTYDAVFMSSFCVDIMRKLPLKSLEEIIRVVKPDGYVVNTGHHSTFVEGEESTAKFRQKLRLLETRGQLRQIELRWFPDYLDNKDGAVSVHQVC